MVNATAVVSKKKALVSIVRVGALKNLSTYVFQLIMEGAKHVISRVQLEEPSIISLSDILLTLREGQRSR